MSEIFNEMCFQRICTYSGDDNYHMKYKSKIYHFSMVSLLLLAVETRKELLKSHYQVHKLKNLILPSISLP